MHRRINSSSIKEFSLSSLNHHEVLHLMVEEPRFLSHLAQFRGILPEGRDASRTTQNTELKLLTAGVEYRSHRGLPDCE